MAERLKKKVALVVVPARSGPAGATAKRRRFPSRARGPGIRLRHRSEGGRGDGQRIVGSEGGEARPTLAT